MPWFVRKNVLPKCPVWLWSEKTREKHPEDGGSSRVSFVDKSCVDICKEQLDPRYVTIERLIADGVQIDVGYTRSLFNFTDPAEIEELNNDVTRSIYNYCLENKDKLFPKKTEES